MNKSIIYIIIFTAFLSRLIYVLTLDEKSMFFDTIHYDTAAMSIIHGHGFGPSLHYAGNGFDQYCLEPVYPIFLSGIYYFFGHHFWVVRIFQVFLGILQCVLLYYLARIIFSEKIALGVLLFSGIYPFYIFIAGLLYPTQLFTLLLTATILCYACYFKKKKIQWLFLASFLLALSILTRPVLLLSIPLFLLWILIFESGHIAQKLLKASLMMIIIIITIAPWTIRNYMTFKRFAPVRACLGEAKILDWYARRFTEEETYSKDLFEGQKFSVYCYRVNDRLFYDTYVDGFYLTTMIVYDNSYNSRKFGSHFGLIFYGGEPNHLLRFRAFHREIGIKDTTDNLILDTDDKILSILMTENLKFENGFYLESSPKGWKEKVLFSAQQNANYFEMWFPPNIHNMDMRRLAILINIDTLELDTCNGFMVWLHPWKEPDLWEIQNSVPYRAVPVIKTMRYDNSKQFEHILRSFLRYPLKFLSRNFMPQFIHFWSPFVSRISSFETKIGLGMQLLSFFSFGPILVFMFFGIFYSRNRLAELVLLLIPVITLSFGYSIFFTEIRYRIPIDGFLMILAILGFFKVSKHFLQLKK